MQDSRAESYMEHHDLKNLFNELEGGLQRHQPNDPFEYIVGCVKTVQQIKRESKGPLLYSKLFEECTTQKHNAVVNDQYNEHTLDTLAEYPIGSNNNNNNNKKRQRPERPEEEAFMDYRIPPPPHYQLTFDQHVPHQDDHSHRRIIIPQNNLSSRFMRNHSSSVGRRGRRPSVSAESIKPSDDPNDRLIIPKSDEIKKRIEASTFQNLLFKNLDREIKQQVFDAMSEVSVQQNDVIIRQGDDGDYFYVIEHGLFEIFIDNKKEQLELGGGTSFGELALMYNVPRAATIRAKTNATLWRLDRVNFRKTLSNCAYHKRKTYETFLRSVSLFNLLTSPEVVKLADSLEPFNYVDGEFIITQGDPGEYFYILEQGQVSVSRIDENSIEQNYPNLQVGDYFGELALLNDQPRQATVVARGPVRVAALNRDAFVRVLGPLKEIFHRNALMYNVNNNENTLNNNYTYPSNYDPSYSPVPSGSLHGDINVSNHNSGDEGMVMDEECSSTSTTIKSPSLTPPAKPAKKSGYSGAGGVDVL
ncbi:hypothetical protein Glove_212g32 [Diversispora epigaea]|uniref:Cyclic nucleotide-binding domain-containing protein n=1 Tax=Diversispora epigaea TaxID=1348612 RepID=A0A397IRD0_9GLOM|nr:hypothetical protein Glove_212g32 [Diversispora epigaea]